MLKKISILGCGWLGLPLGSELVKQGYAVLGSTTRKEKFGALKANGIQPFQIQLPTLTAANAPFFEADVLILNIPPGRKNPNVVQDHLRDVKTIVNAVKGGSIRKLIFVSSTGVFGNSNGVVTENTPRDPIRNSGKALVGVEDYLRQQTWLQTTIVRMAGLVGGNRKAGRFFAGKKNVPMGNAPVNMVHRTDCINIVSQLMRMQLWGDTFHVCADKHPTKRAFYTAQAIKDGLEPPTFLDTDNLQFKLISNAKVKQTLDYELVYPDPMKF